MTMRRNRRIQATKRSPHHRRELHTDRRSRTIRNLGVHLFTLRCHLRRKTQRLLARTLFSLRQNLFVSQKSRNNFCQQLFICIHLRLILLASLIQGRPGQVHTRLPQTSAVSTLQRRIRHNVANTIFGKTPVAREFGSGVDLEDFVVKTKLAFAGFGRHDEALAL